MAHDKDKRGLPNIEEISKPVPAVSEFCSVTRLSDLFQEAESDTLPVVNLQGKVTGIVSEHDLARITPEMSSMQDGYLCSKKVTDIMTKQVWTENKKIDIKNLLDKIPDMHARVVPIVDDNNYYTGSSISRSSIISYLTKQIKPDSLGGLATPLGVYITDGRHQAGVGNFGLFLTGVSIGAMIFAVERGYQAFFSYFKINYLASGIYPIAFIAEILTFMFILRFTPLAKIHAAEHQTINAIEKGVPLKLESVKLQAKEHVRCGTNLMVLIIGIQVVILFNSAYLSGVAPIFQFIFLFWAFIYVFSEWKKWGMLLQKYFTTVNPPDKYILNAIKAGEEVLDKYKKDFSAKPPPVYRKIWNSAIIQIVSGFIFTQWLLESLFKKLIL
jgi:predicted transcriptional regulator